jgi:heme-degrading monooxygenase HmoA
MIVMFSARRLKPGAWEQFRRAWDPGSAKPPGFQRADHARNIRDEDEVISFGLFDMTENDYRRWRRGDAAGRSRVRVRREPAGRGRLRGDLCRGGVGEIAAW